jgi:cytochrome c oxidase assembly protein subunit 19
MNVAGAAGPLARKPPINGSFPLDHEGQCRTVVGRYLKCLQEHGSDQTACRALAKIYLACRMDRGLMARDEWPTLGFPDEHNKSAEINNSDKDKKG